MRACSSNTTITLEKYAISVRVMATLGIITHPSIFFHTQEFVASNLAPNYTNLQQRRSEKQDILIILKMSPFCIIRKASRRLSLFKE